MKEIKPITEKLDDKIKALNSTRVYKKVTPMHDLSWYVKWVSVVFVIVGWMLHAVNLYPMNVAIQMIGVAGWLWVSIIWNDRALIIVNAVAVAIFLNGIVNWMIKVI